MSIGLKAGDIVFWWEGRTQQYVLGTIVRSRLIRKENEYEKVWDVMWSDTGDVCEYATPTIIDLRQRYEEYESSRKASSQA